MVDLVSLPAGLKWTDHAITDSFEGAVHRIGGGRVESNVDPDYVFQMWRARSIPMPPATVKTVRDFFWACRGDKGHAFLFTDPLDNSFEDINIGTGDGSETEFQLRNAYSNGVRTYFHPVAFPGAGSLTIEVNSVEMDVSSDYTLGSTGLITFTSAPANGHVITASCTAYSKAVRFASGLDIGVAQALDDDNRHWREIRVTLEEVNPL